MKGLVGFVKQNPLIVISVFVVTSFVLGLYATNFAMAAVITDNVTLQDFTVNASSTFNFTSQSYGSSGYVKFENNAIVAINGAKLKDGGFHPNVKNEADFYNNLLNVPNSSFSDFASQSYGSQSSVPISSADVGRIIAFMIPGSIFYAAIYIKEFNSGSNVTFAYKFNNQDGNNTFGGLSGCNAHTTFNSCVEDRENNCEWYDPGATCIPRGGIFGDIPPAECGMLPQSACNGIANTTCVWDSTQGTAGKCIAGGAFNISNGFTCADIINDTLCNNQPFTERTGLCTWNGTACNVNVSKTFNDLPNPPVFSCEAPDALNNQTFCEDLANTYYMPCGWDTTKNRCGPLFFDFAAFEDFDDIGSENNCNMMGGTWRTETVYDPITNKVSSESWCEFGVNVKLFDEVGAGGGNFAGNISQVSDCSRDCFACEFQSDGTRWPNSSIAQTQCTSSIAGCSFRADTHAFNGQGWCEPVGVGSCDDSCGNCNFMPDPQNSCINSGAGCRWDNVTSVCIDSGESSCDQKCTSCNNAVECTNSGANCKFNNQTSVCEPASGVFEICFDGIDNDNDGKTDCSDPKCSSDPFCGGDIGDSANCFQYDSFTYGAGAEGNCTAVPECSWLTNDVGDSYCAPISDSCWENETLSTNQTACEGFGGGDVCVFESEPRCDANKTMMQNCFGQPNSTACSATTGCAWNPDFNVCDFAPIVNCEFNTTLQNNETACLNAGCYWRSQNELNQDAFFQSRCVAPYYNSSIVNSAQCAAANGSVFPSGISEWVNGSCEPKNFIGGCFQNDGDITSCQANSNCDWFEDDFGPLKNLNSSSTDFANFHHPGTTWIAIGLQEPTGTGPDNESTYILNRTTDGVYVKLVSTLLNASNEPENIIGLKCNETFISYFNFTSSACNGTCNAYAKSTCGGNTVHYFIDNTSAVNTVEALWEVSTSLLNLDVLEGNNYTTTTTNKSTVQIDGNLSEHVWENSSENAGYNATRVLTSAGFCKDVGMNTFFAGMDQEPPIELARDTVDGVSDPLEDYLNIKGLGVKKTPEAYIYGIPVQNVTNSALCNQVPIYGGAPGSGANTSKYYLYLDTDGVSTGGCAASDDASVVGFEYRFKYIVEMDVDTNRVSETKLSEKCSSGTWIPTNIPLTSDRIKACGFVGGPIIGIDKNTLTGKNDVDITKPWRAYAASTNITGTVSSVLDTVGPGSADFRGIDAEIVDCTSIADKDNRQCTKFKQFGFFPGEFGPACKDNIDNDGDGNTDCDDLDCKYDPFFCTGNTFGSFSAQADDDTSPTIVFSKVNNLPTSLTFIFDTNEPANGTVKFYGNTSSCSTLNTTLPDIALTNLDTFDDYRTHHVVEKTGLTPNTTYYYKLKSCDPSNNCVTTTCSSVTTSSDYEDITFKLVIPNGYSVDIPSLNLTNYSLSYALKASTKFTNNMNITINDLTNPNRYVKMVGVDIFKKGTFNLSAFISGINSFGIDTNQYQAFKQKTGLKSVNISIPSTGDTIFHCDDNGANCVDVTSKLSCTFGASNTECEIPDAVGFGFSTYKVSTSSSSSGSSSGSSGGSSGGGGGYTSDIVASHTWTSVKAGEEKSKTFDKTDVSEVLFTLLKDKENVKLSVTQLSIGFPSDVPEPEGTLIAALKIDLSNVEDSDISSAKIKFEVGKSWLSDNGFEKYGVVLQRYTTEWNKLETSVLSENDDKVYFEAITPGFSYFAITAEKPVVEPTEPEEPSESEQPTEPSKPTQPEQPAEPTTPDNRMFLVVAIVVIIIIIALIAMVSRRK